MPIQDWIQEGLKPGDLTLLQHIKSGSLPSDAELDRVLRLIKTGYLKKGRGSVRITLNGRGALFLRSYCPRL